MRVAVLTLAVLCAFVAGVVANPVAPIVNGNNFQGGMANCQPGYGVINPTAGATGNLGCAQCVAGYYQQGTGALACTACPAGTWSPQGSTACYTCPAGTISPTGSPNCQQCGYGTSTGYQYVNSVWVSIASNQYQSSTTCYPCDVNYYQPTAGSQACISCPSNTNTAGARGAGTCVTANGGHTVASFLEADTEAETETEVEAEVESESEQPAPAAPGPVPAGANNGKDVVLPYTKAPHAPVIVPHPRGNYKGAHPAAVHAQHGAKNTAVAAGRRARFAKVLSP